MGNNKHTMKPEKEKRGGRYRFVKILTIVLSVILGVLLIGGGVMAIGVYRLLNGMQEGPTTTLDAAQQQSLIDAMNEEDQADPEDLEGLDEADEIDHTGVKEVEAEEGVFNFLLLGLDTRSEEELEKGRTDVNMIVTLDTKNHSIKLTSLMRDILLPIEGHDKNRLNTINVFLGADALVETVEKYTGIPIEGYVKVNFSCVASIVDILGGVDMELSSGEVYQTNLGVKEQNAVDKVNSESSLLKGNGGQYHLNGKQAVAYMRIRHLAGGEFVRTSRQRKVISQVMDDMKDISLSDAMQLVTQITPYMKTNLSSNDIIKYATMLYNLRDATVEDLNIPVEGAYKSVSYKGMAVFQIDFDKNAEIIQNFIFGDGSLVPKEEGDDE